MLSEREIAINLMEVIKKMIEKKQKNENDKESNLYFGCAFGFLTVLGRADGLMEAENQLGYINSVLIDILGEPNIPLEADSETIV